MREGLVAASLGLPWSDISWTFPLPLLSLPFGPICPARRMRQNCRKILTSPNECDHLDLRYNVSFLRKGKSKLRKLVNRGVMICPTEMTFPQQNDFLQDYSKQ